MSEDKQYPEAVVAAVIYNDQGEILLVRASKWGEYWQIPGGHIESGETAEAALKREIREETGLEIDQIKFNDLQDCIYPKQFERKVHFVFLDYSARMSGGEMAEKNAEMAEYKWIKPEAALKELKMNPYTEISVKKFIASQQGSYEDKYKRALADYQNLAKQTAKEKLEFAVYANEQMLKEILPVYSHLKMALEHHNGESADQWLEGVKHVVKQFKDVLEKLGVKEIKTQDQAYDHNTMEALSSEETDNKKLDGKVARQMKAGYTLNGKVIEAAKVVVYKLKQ